MKNWGELITSIKMDLGIYGISLPFEGNTDDILAEVITLKTLKQFSIIHPFALEQTIDLNVLERIKTGFDESVYILPEVFGDAPIIGIRRVEPRNPNMPSTGYMTNQFEGSMGLYQDAMMAQLNVDNMSLILPAFTFKFTAPNKMHLYNLTSFGNQVTVEFELAHTKSLSTIKPRVWDEFEELALLDVKRFLYNAMKHYSELQTAFGTINLRLDDWASAESDRKDLLSRWKEIYHLDSAQIYWI